VGFGDSRLPPLLEITLYRIAQEALVNAARHGDPATVSVVLERRDGHVILIVEDDGKGFELARIMDSELGQKLGLFGMQERVSLVGGTLTIESSPGQGTSVFAEAPIAADAEVS
jgi:signal transduction histidine kinase